MSTVRFRESIAYNSSDDESSLQRSSSLTGSLEESCQSQQMALQELKEECYEMNVQQQALKEKYETAKRSIYRQHFDLQSNVQLMFSKYLSNIDTLYETKINLLKTRQKRCESAYKSLSKPRGRKMCYDENDPHKHRITGTLPNIDQFDFGFISDMNDIEDIENFNFDMLDMDGIMRELNLLNNNLILDGAWCQEAEAEAEIEKIQIDDGDEGMVGVMINNDEDEDEDNNHHNNNNHTPHDTTPHETPLGGTPYTNHTVSIQPTPHTVDSYIVYTPEYINEDGTIEFRALKMPSNMDGMNNNNNNNTGSSNNTGSNIVNNRVNDNYNRTDRKSVVDMPKINKKKPNLNRVQSERSATVGNIGNHYGMAMGNYPTLKSFGSLHNPINISGKKHRNLLMQSTTSVTNESDEINTDSKEFSSVRSIWEQMARKTKNRNKEKKEKNVGRKRSFTSH